MSANEEFIYLAEDGSKTEVPANSTLNLEYADYAPLDTTPYQFMRVYELIIADGYEKSGVAIQDLQVTFSVKKVSNDAEEPSEATISIVNLAEDTAKLLAKKWPVVMLKVGYLKTGLQTLFQGEVYDLETKRQGTDRITTFKATPFKQNMDYGYVSGFVAAGGTLANAFDKIRESMGAVKGIWRSEKLNYSAPFGWTLSGSPKQELQRLCDAYNLEYRIDKNILYINDIATSTDSTVATAPLLTYTTGLLEGPYDSTTRIKRGKLDPLRKKSFYVKALLNPSVRAGWMVKIQGTSNDGVYKVESANFRGDYRGGDWVMELDLVTTDEFAKLRAEDARKAAKKDKNKKEEVK